MLFLFCFFFAVVGLRGVEGVEWLVKYFKSF